MTRRPADHRPGPRRPESPPAPGRRGWVAAAALAVAVAGAGLWWWRSETRVDKVRGIEHALLAGQLPGRAGRRAVDEVIRTVDRMRPEELQEVRRTLEEEWERSCREDVAAFRSAGADERAEILDRSIRRGLVYQELLFAVNPRARTRDYRRPRRPGRAAAESQASRGGGEAVATPQEQDRFRKAVLERARERRIDVPVWQ